MDTEDHIELDPLAAKMEEALLLSDMSATQFGYLHFGNPAFFTKMRRGNRFNRATITKVNALLEKMGLA